MAQAEKDCFHYVTFYKFFIHLLDLVYQNKKKKVFGFLKFWLLDYISGLGARNLLYLPRFHAYISFCSCTLLWLNFTVIYVWSCVESSVKKKKAHFNYFFPAIEQKHSPGFPTVGKSRPGWAVDEEMCSRCDLALWVWIYWFTAAFTCVVVKCSVLSLSQEPLGIKVSILLPMVALLFFSGPGCVPD